MLQQDTPEDYVVATGMMHSVCEFLIAAFAAVGIDDWQRYVQEDPSLFRPAEVDLLVGDALKARKQLGWQPTVTFEQLVQMMVESDIQALSQERAMVRQSVLLP